MLPAADERNAQTSGVVIAAIVLGAVVSHIFGTALRLI